MSPTLSLRRDPKKTDLELDTDQSDDVDVEDLPPIADGRHQTRSALGAKAATVGLLTCLVLGPVGAVAGGLAYLQSSQPSAAPVAAAVDQSNERAIVGQFAQQVVVTWLTTTQDKADALTALIKDAQVSGLSQTAFKVEDPAVSGITSVDGTWSVIVAATVTDAHKTTARRYFQIPVRYDHGSVTALTLPAPVSPPLARVGSTTGYRIQVDLSTPLGQTVSQFLTAYIAGFGDVGRYLTPGFTLIPLTPAPYTSVRLSEIRAADSDQPSATVPRDGSKTRVLALGTGLVTDQQTANVAYALTLTARAGRWEISAIDPTPVQQQSQTPAASSATGPASTRPPGSATTPPDTHTSATTP
mgnify:CR=1 FL=1